MSILPLICYEIIFPELTQNPCKYKFYNKISEMDGSEKQLDRINIFQNQFLDQSKTIHT